MKEIKYLINRLVLSFYSKKVPYPIFHKFIDLVAFDNEYSTTKNYLIDHKVGTNGSIIDFLRIIHLNKFTNKSNVSIM